VDDWACTLNARAGVGFWMIGFRFTQRDVTMDLPFYLFGCIIRPSLLLELLP